MHSVLRWHRRSKWCKKNKMSFVASKIDMLIRIIFACDLSHSCEIGKDVGFFHNGLGCVIHKNCKIGDRSKIYQNVTIGGNGKKGIKNGVPEIGKNVTIYSGVSIGRTYKNR